MLVEDVTSVLRRERAALARLEEARDVGGLRRWAAASLLFGDARSVRESPRRAELGPLLEAMAEVGPPGGLSRARSILARAARGPDAEPAVLFLAALAFESEGQADQADTLLARAVTGAPSALDRAFSPDPAVLLVEATLPELSRAPAAKLALARALADAGRRGAAHRLLETLEGKEGETEPAALSLTIELWSERAPDRALRAAERLLARVPQDALARVTRAESAWRRGELDAARRAVDGLAPPSRALESRTERLRARLFLEAKDAEGALKAAEQAVRLDPKSDAGLELLVQAMIAARQTERARAFAEELLKRAPLREDPFRLLAALEAERGRDARARADELRSEALRRQRERVDGEVSRREAVLAWVRDAEAGLGLTGVEALRGRDPVLGLPLDLLLAARGAPGTRRAARERILAVCGDDLERLLAARDTWDRVAVAIAPYGKERLEQASLSGADPGRCSAGATALTRRSRR